MHAPRGLIFASVLASLLSGALLGCKGDSGGAAAQPTASTQPAPPRATPGGEGSTSASEGGAESPEAAFETLKKGVNTKEYRSFFKVLAKESQDQMLATAV